VIAVAGAGVFGLSAALELRRRGHAVTVFDPGPLPRPEAASVGSSRAVRMDYGGDAFHASLAEAALERWESWDRRGEEPVFHGDGFVLLTRGPMQPGEFEHDSFELLSARGHVLERLDAKRIEQRFPAFAEANFVDGYFNPRGGWVDAGAVMRQLVARAGAANVGFPGLGIAGLVERHGAVVGVTTAYGAEHRADVVLLALGAWTPALLPWLADRMRPVAQPVVHFGIEDPDFGSPRLCPFGAEIARTGWYGFPAHHDVGFKIANHGLGVALDLDGPRRVPAESLMAAREFVSETFPAVCVAPVARAAICFYCDTFDGDFWIDHDPERPGLVVAAGGSGHGFKFAPLLGEIIANVVERRADPRTRRFAWRDRGPAGCEGARRRG